MSTDALVKFLAGEHTALHIGFPEWQVNALRNLALGAEAFFVELELGDVADVGELFTLISKKLQFPKLEDNWDAVEDWATDPTDFLENEVGYIITVTGFEDLKMSPFDRECFFDMWLTGPRSFQFDDRIYHVVFVGNDDHANSKVKEIWKKNIERTRFPMERIREAGARSNRIPVVDWQSGTPEVVLS